VDFSSLDNFTKMVGDIVMKMLFVENDLDSVLKLIQTAKTIGWHCGDYGLSLPVNTDELHRFLDKVCEENPDVVIIDIALSEEEESLIDDVSLENSVVQEEQFSGFKYCRALSCEKWNIPVVFLTQIDRANVTRAALKAGANLVLVKTAMAGNLMAEIVELVRSRAAHDPKFFWQLSDVLTTGTGIWQRGNLEQALNRFFLNDSTVRRFGLFTASLRGILSPLFQGDVIAEKKLMVSLVKSQVLLSLVDPRLRDHVKHTGNVFWMGYRMLHEILEFHEPISLPGHNSSSYDLHDVMDPREQLMYAWTLAALFHDYGYVDERQNQLIGLISTLIPGVNVTHADVRSEQNWAKNMRMLRDFVKGLVGDTHFLYHFIDAVFTSFGSDFKCRDSKDMKTNLVDHGFLSAHRLLDMVPIEKLDAQKRNVVLHAAVAIACHHYVEMYRKWEFPSECEGRLSAGTFPICSLLAFCDTVQTWDREMNADSTITRTDAYDGLFERLILSHTAYISGSEICELSISKNGDAAEYDIKLKLRYFVEVAGGANKACESLRDDIQGWIDSGRLRDVCDKMGLSSLLHGKIIYELPLLSGSREVDF
jgi:CheY-like chemotaxis protein